MMVNIQRNMKAVAVTLSDDSLRMVTEIAEALARVDGGTPNRSRAVRVAIACARKRLSDEGLLNDLLIDGDAR